MRKPHRYPEVESSPDFAGLEEKILEQWQQDDAFRRSVDRRPERVDGKSNRYVFYDGPPFANGLPHYGHLLTGYVKDAIARYWTMRGKHVERRFGWDCHGLPAEMGAEKELKLSGRAAILEYGIEKFNAHCRSSVMQYVADWRYYVTRQGRWVDFDHDYKTMDTSYMESVLWAFKQLYDKGLVYESMRVMPYSWAAETPLSNFETKLDNSYRDRDDKAAYVKFKLKDKPPRFVPEELEKSGVRIENYYLVAWTTTPWTLPANLALAVNPEMKYSYTVIPAQAGISREAGARGEGDSRLRGNDVLITASFAEPEVVGYLDTPVRWEIEGRDLIGLSYEPLFPFFKDISPNAFKIYAADFVTEGDGTGVVHMAPGFGEDDHRLAQEKGIPTVVPVDGRGFYTSEVGEFAGLHVIWDEASNHKHTGNEAVLKNLKERGLLLKQETYRHSYPHCWRTDTPLIYRAMSSWYVAVTKFRDRAVEINKTIDWIPEHVRDGQMHHMLATAPDWSISRNRFWGAPIPIWRSPSGKVKAFGSIAEIEAASGKKVTDLHRPFIDEIVIVEDGEEFRRVEDVFDCWFESGSMPYAQLHYPFENKERFEENFPADFITEYVGQTRGWFNTLLMLSTELFGCAPFKHCICHGVVLDDKGQKLSKRAGNYADPKMLFDTFGADALRWFMLSSPVMRGGEMHIDKEGRFIRDVVRLAVKPIWNAYHFFTLYANADGVEARDYLRHMENFGVSPNLMDAYILTKCQVAVEQIGASLDAYDTPGATDAVTAFFEVLNNWYIRRSRPRFWAEEGSPQKRSAYDTLFTVLNALVVASAPLLPFLCETVYQGLNDTKESVHWQDFPDLGGAITALTNEGPDEQHLLAGRQRGDGHGHRARCLHGGARRAQPKQAAHPAAPANAHHRCAEPLRVPRIRRNGGAHQGRGERQGSDLPAGHPAIRDPAHPDQLGRTGQAAAGKNEADIARVEEGRVETGGRGGGDRRREIASRRIHDPARAQA